MGCGSSRSINNAEDSKVKVNRQNKKALQHYNQQKAEKKVKEQLHSASNNHPQKPQDHPEEKIQIKDDTKLGLLTKEANEVIKNHEKVDNQSKEGVQPVIPKHEEAKQQVEMHNFKGTPQQPEEVQDGQKGTDSVFPEQDAVKGHAQLQGTVPSSSLLVIKYPKAIFV
jgi:hypothetical protein